MEHTEEFGNDIKPIWMPDPEQLEQTAIVNFAKWSVENLRAPISDTTDYQQLWQWSVDDTAGFWSAVAGYFEVEFSHPAEEILVADGVKDAQWFSGATLNYAEEALRRGSDQAVALIGISEGGEQRSVTFAELRANVASLADCLRRSGIIRGDRVVGYLPNIIETVVAFLATASIGAIWSQCAPDYGAPAALDRFSQLNPKALVAASGYEFGGKLFDRRQEVRAIRDALPDLQIVIHIDHVDLETTIAPTGPAISWTEALCEQAEPFYEAVGFDQPLWVLFTSGTTGLPKGIVHGHGGIVLQQLVFNGLQLDLSQGDSFFWFSSTNWVMWNLLVSGLLLGSTVVLYDGNPTYPDVDRLWKIADDTGARVFGTSPGYLLTCEKKALQPRSTYGLVSLKILGSTGSILPAASYEWVRDQVGAAVQVASVSGGTDIAGAFVASAPNTPVWAGELSAAALGVALESWDTDGQPSDSAIGELVVTKPLPSMPLHFWNDPDGSRYQQAYFETFPGVWRQGDWITLTDRGSVVMHGRSDATLNRHGVRLGSSDVYEVVEALPYIVDSLIVGVELAQGGYWMPLFVVLQDDVVLNQAVTDQIRQAIRTQASPRHVPDVIIAMESLPRTKTGKKLEIPVKRILQGAPPEVAVSFGALENPESLRAFQHIAIPKL